MIWFALPWSILGSCPKNGMRARLLWRLTMPQKACKSITRPFWRICLQAPTLLWEALERQRQTTGGTRPGDPVADILFNMAFRLVVLDARERFQQASAFTFIGSPNPASNILSPKKMPNEGFPEVSFVDDIAYVMHSKCPAALVGSLQHVASCLHDAAASRGLTVNYGSGKAEAMVRLAGPGSAAIKFGMP